MRIERGLVARMFRLNICGIHCRATIAEPIKTFTFMLPLKISSSRPSASTIGSAAPFGEAQQIAHRGRAVTEVAAGTLGQLQNMQRKMPEKSGRRPNLALKLDIAGMRKQETESLDRLRQVSNGSIHFHGSRSGSLITFHQSTNAEMRGSLLPMGTLLAHKAAVYSGERGSSLEERAFNSHHLSVVGEENFIQAVRYATDKEYASSSPIQPRLPVSPAFGAWSSADKAKQLQQAADAKPSATRLSATGSSTDRRGGAAVFESIQVM